MFLFLSLRFNPDPNQKDFSASLEALIKGMEKRDLRTPPEGSTSEGVSLMRAGQGALMLDTAVAQLHKAGFYLVEAYTRQDEAGITKITFVAEDKKVSDRRFTKVLNALTKDSGWTVRRYTNPSGAALSGMNPVNRRAQIAKANARGKRLKVTRVKIA